MSATKAKAVPAPTTPAEIVRMAQVALDQTVACSTYKRWQFRGRLRRQLKRAEAKS